MADVFISYKQEEREAVQIIATALNDLKLSVWFDSKLRAGGSFDEEIAEALNAAKAVLVCWTPAAMQSEWVRGEATSGMQGGRLAACMLQPATLIPPFNLTHAENLTAWAGQPDDPAWLKLLERIGELVGRPGLATTDADYARIADALQIDAATLFAVIEVETTPTAPAFAPDGRPTILFEPHIFSRFTGRAYDAAHPAISYQRWRTLPYPATQAERWAQLEQAAALDYDNALRAASFGRFQILGQNHVAAGFETPGEFVRFLSESEANQLEAALLGFIRGNNLEDELQRKDWVGFALRYNGPRQRRTTWPPAARSL